MHLSDGAAIDIMNDVFKENDIKNLNEQPKEVQREVAVTLRSKGLSIRQISRLTGISKSIVEARQ